ncbi:MAG: LPXTG cell wall anchor domain-containing protein [Ornithinibacter sp.]
MSTPTTPRAALLRRAGTLLVAAALVGAPASAAFADPTASPTTTASVDAVPTAAAVASPSPSTTASGEATASTDPAATPTQSPTDPAPSASPSNPAPSPSDTTSPDVPTPPSSSPSRSASTVPAPAIAAVAGDEDTAAAKFIARTLAAGGDHYVYPGGTFFDGGNTIDGIIALSAVGTEQAQADASLAYLKGHLGDYIGSGKEVYAGPLAKTLLAVVVAGGSTTAFGDHDLVAELRALETTEGRFSDQSAFGDFSNTIGQSLAVIALARAGQGINVRSVEQLLGRQCADGGFSGSLDKADTCVSDADATAFAVQALLAAGASTYCNGDTESLAARAAAGAEDGLDRLEAIQGSSGGFTSADGAVNANTTGVAAQALTAGSRTTAAGEAVAFIKGLQYVDTTKPALLGGIAFSAGTLSTTVPTDSDLRATPQATLGLAAGSLVSVAAPGVEDAGPAATCPPAPTRLPVVAPPTTTPSSSPSTTTRPTSSGGSTQGDAGSGGSGGSGPSTTVEAAAGTGSLAQTGSDVMAPVLLGLMLVLVGGLAVWFSTRRRGAHA